MAEGYQRFPIAKALMNGDVPLGSHWREDSQGLSGVRPSHVRQVTKGTAMGVFVGVKGGKRDRLERERSRNQQQNCKPPYAWAAKCHRRLNYTSVHAGT